MTSGQPPPANIFSILIKVSLFLEGPVPGFTAPAAGSTPLVPVVRLRGFQVVSLVNNQQAQQAQREEVAAGRTAESSPGGSIQDREGERPRPRTSCDPELLAQATHSLQALGVQCGCSVWSVVDEKRRGKTTLPPLALDRVKTPQHFSGLGAN